ncbi:septal ring lytic transglycosylase RlpA family protein [Oleidesulfovibrio sp.]|uniref:septal ring lytic transglycosylase RlpA family protein n=1 Tax=Oleidesulfovibrio sp. TaxID=2909707 RepID=UPI003A892D56
MHNSILQRRTVRILLLVTAAVMLAFSGGCGKKVIAPTTQPAPAPKGKQKPYTYSINGKTYTTMTSAHGYTEDGLASWYGKDFHGRKTANGEIYDMYGMTAAHKLLPFGTRLKVTNLENGKVINVVVNDRGPFVKDRIIDLTYTGAQRLDMVGPGIARVRIESLGDVPTYTNGEMTGRFYVQIGAFSKRDNAEALRSRMAANGKPARVVFAEDIGFWRVQVGSYSKLSAAEAARDSMRGEFPNSFILAD